MNELEKKALGPGPWQDEPDRVEWRHADLSCLIVRQLFGFLCGYVGVPPGHPAHGADYDNLDVSVHAGLTYSGACQGEICHVPAPGEPEDIWWFGFDCAHCSDVTPGLPFQMAGALYRDLAYVRRQVEQLAKQLAAMRTSG